MMDRIDTGGAFEFHEKLALFTVQIRYWRAVLERLQPDYVIFPVQPHMLYDYLIYELCQDFGIGTCMFQWTLFHDTLYPIHHIDRGYSEIEALYQARLQAGAVTPVLSARTEAYLARVAGTYRDAIPRYLLEKMPSELRAGVFAPTMRAPLEEAGDYGLLEAASLNGRAAGAESTPVLAPAPEAPREKPRPVPRAKRMKALRKDLKILRKSLLHWKRQTLDPVAADLRPSRLARRATAARRAVWRSYRRWVRPVLRSLQEGGLDRPLKERGRSMETSFSGRLGGVRWQITRIKGLRKKRRLLEHYRRLATPFDVSAPYVFVALHYQPEQTTCPTGGVFVDQWLLVDLLSKSVPEGWLIYVKEHPFQFFPDGIGERGRTTDFYDDLVALPNVRLVPWTTSPFTLIDGAKAIATVTGTTGTEAVLRGKPVLVFGYAWYRGCDGVFYTPTAESCRAAIARIADGYRPDPQKVRLFFQVVEELSVVVDLGIGDRSETLTHDENVARVAKAIMSRLAPQHPAGEVQPATPPSRGLESERGPVSA
jgi:hypothetical protein